LRNSIVFKLWLSMTALVLLVLTLAWFVHTNIQTRRYFQQQGDELVREGYRISALLEKEQSKEQQEQILRTSAKVLNAVIMLMDKEEFLEQCQNLHDNYSGNDPKLIHHDPLVDSEVKSLFAGKPIVHLGPGKILDLEVISAGVPVMSGNKVEKIIMLHAPVAPISNRINDLKQVTLNVGLEGIFIATILSFLLSRRFSNPLLEMNKVAQAMAHGDYRRRVHKISNDEVGLLANSLNTLALKLEEKITALEKIDSTRREFVANVAHELRTPLTIMQGYTEALVDGIADDPQEQNFYLNNIQDELKRLNRLVLDLLDLKRLESGQHDFTKDFVDIKTTVEKVVKKFEPSVKKNKIQIKTSFAANLEPIMGNADRLEQVLINLIANAINVSAPGDVIMVTAGSGAGCLHISVSDTGPGIPKEELPFIFERFYKTDKSRKRSTNRHDASNGTGLGLAIVKGIVEAHGGMINVQSRVGRGTTFTISIPNNQRK